MMSNTVKAQIIISKKLSKEMWNNINIAKSVEEDLIKEITKQLFKKRLVKFNISHSESYHPTVIYEAELTVN